jgi:diacylglycerol kinase family enzyme
VGDLFRAAGHDAQIVAMRRGENPAELARSASSRFSIVVAAGGDGTVSSVAAGILDSPATLGVLPLGTLNHFAKIFTSRSTCRRQSPSSRPVRFG